MVEAGVTSPADLPESCDSRFDAESPHEMGLAEQRHIAKTHGPRADQRNLPPQYVPQLRKFVQRCLPQDSADWSYARIVPDFEDGPIGFIERLHFFHSLLCIHHHGAKLKQFEFAAAVPIAFLHKQHGTRIK